MSKNSLLIETLKGRWLTNFAANLLIKSSHADRRIREIRKTPPKGYVLLERQVVNNHGGKFIKCLEFTLEKAS